MRQSHSGVETRWKNYVTIYYINIVQVVKLCLDTRYFWNLGFYFQCTYLFPKAHHKLKLKYIVYSWLKNVVCSSNWWYRKILPL